MLLSPTTSRSYKHNLRLAALLCITAGMVNVAGFIGFTFLTTNVTGHVAVFAEHIAKGDIVYALKIGVWMFLFLLGAFASSLHINRVGRENKNAYTFPILVEITLLMVVAMYSHITHAPHAIRYCTGMLIFAMGLQNALVTMISGAVVRTTHLTGTFTDLGIDIATIFYSEGKVKQEYGRRIVLRITTIGSFIFGGVIGGFLFYRIDYYTLFVPAGILVIILLYDAYRERFSENLDKD